MSEWFTLVFVTAAISIAAVVLLSKLSRALRRKIKNRQKETQRKREQRELYLSLLKLKNSRRRLRRYKSKS